jgi:hypothetical protein
MSIAQDGHQWERGPRHYMWWEVTADGESGWVPGLHLFPDKRIE